MLVVVSSLMFAIRCCWLLVVVVDKLFVVGRYLLCSCVLFCCFWVLCYVCVMFDVCCCVLLFVARCLWLFVVRCLLLFAIVSYV